MTKSKIWSSLYNTVKKAKSDRKLEFKRVASDAAGKKASKKRKSADYSN
jgi:hypothetical protein